MTMQEEQFTAEELNAFVDGELDEARRRKLADQIATAPALARQIAELQVNKQRLLQVYGALIDQPVPQALLDRARAPRPPRALLLWQPVFAAAMAMAVAVLLFIGYGLWTGSPREPLIDQALAARNGAVASASQVAEASLASAAERDRIVSDNIAVPVRVPDLRKAGYDLAAITLFPGKRPGRAVQLTYLDGRGRAFTVYLAHQQLPEGFQLIERGRLRLCIWQTEELSAVMAGEMSTDEMLRLASLTYADLNF